MKKITAIFFLILFSFNWFGYRLLFDYMQHKTNANLEALLDNNSYDDAQLIELKIPINVAYQNNTTEFERYNGEVELNGTLYKYVKRKVTNDTLYLMCIPNTKKMHLETAKNDFFKISNDLAQSNNSKKPDNSTSVFKNLQTVYNNSFFGLIIISPFAFQQNCWLPVKTNNLLFSPHISPEQPPDLLRA